MTALSVMGLLPPGVRMTEGSVVVGGRDLATLDPRERRTVRGAEVAMIYQDPMTSLNPLMRVGAQVVEGLAAHGVRGDEARRGRSRPSARWACPGRSGPAGPTRTSSPAASGSG